jgi:hypothetical protein
MATPSASALSPLGPDAGSSGNNDLGSKTQEIARAWQALHRTQDRLLQERLSVPGKDPYGSLVLGMALGNVTLDQTLRQPLLSTKPKDANGKPITLRAVRMPFVVLKVLKKGFASGTNAAEKHLRSKGREPLAFMHNEHHVRIHQFADTNSKNRGERLPECVLVSPGMVFSLSVVSSIDSKDAIHTVFESQTSDIRPFDMLLLELILKGNKVVASAPPESLESKLGLRSVVQLPGLTPASVFQVPARLASTSLDNAAALAHRFAEGTHLQAEAVELRGPLEPGLKDEEIGVSPCETFPTLKQTLLRNNLAKTNYFLHVVPRTGTVGTGADDVLRYYGDASLAEATGLTIATTFPVRYDETQYGGLEWAIKLFNHAIAAGALEILIAADLYASDQREPSLVGFLRVRHARFMDIFLHRSPRASMPEGVVSTFKASKRGGALRHLGLFTLPEDDANETLVWAIDTRVETNALTPHADDTKTEETGEGPPRPVTLRGALMPKEDPSWQTGHTVYVFHEGRLVFYFMAPLTLHGIKVKPVLDTRRIESVALPPASSLMDDDDVDNDAMEEEPAAPATPPPPAPAPKTPAPAPPPVAKRATKPKRPRAASEDEDEEAA